MGNYVILPVGNYVLTSALQLGNYVIADTMCRRPDPALPEGKGSR